MKHLLFLLSFFALLLPTGSAQQSSNMSLLGAWNDTGLLLSGGRRYSDVWGYAANGREFALLGSREFVIVLDITDPSNIVEIDRLNTFANSATTWRDIKVYGDYAYFVVDVNTTEGLQIIDLSGLKNAPYSASIIYQSSMDFQTCHNLIVDETSNPVRLYAFGTNAGAQQTGYIVYSLANPAAPSLIASVNLNTSPYTGGYIHDAYAVNDTLYANHGNKGMYVYDVTNPASPLELGLFANYDGVAYNHSNWRTTDGKHVVMCDETTNKDVKIVKVDTLNDMKIVGRFKSQLRLPDNSSHLAHNPYVLGDSLVVMSYYRDGIQVWDIKDRTNPKRLAYYDTSPGSSTSSGVWGAYPYLPSGNILASDMRDGLFVVKVDNYSALPVTYGSWAVKEDSKNALLAWQTISEADNAGWEVEHAAAGGQFSPIGFVAANDETEYAFTHTAPGLGLHYYRLRQQDFDGTEQLSDVRSVVFSGSPGSLKAYPNPVHYGAPILLIGIASEASWTIHDLNGRVVLRGQTNRIDHQLPSGIYFLKSGEEVAKLVVE